jgi:2-keto-4-pentenoate hydratase/2-oxohepta-3-ene-1,7-dioic acid hydratase in catechol pathway
MKIVTYECRKKARLGAVEGKVLVDIHEALDLVRKGRLPRDVAGQPRLKTALAELKAAPATPRDMIDLLGRGEKWLRAMGALSKALARARAPQKPAVKAEACGGLTAPLSAARLLAPIARPGKIICVGLNYADHAREQGIEPPDRPIFFLKSNNTIIGPDDPVVIPPNSEQVDFEAEFAVVIGKVASRVAEPDAMSCVAGYMILHDVTARDMQHGDKQWFRGKSCDTFGPIGPWILTRDEVADPNNLAISCSLNGETMQDSNTSNLIFKIPFLVSYLSQSITLEPGDLISTGTPPGVGVFRTPPIFLKPGDTVSVTVEKLGTLTNPVVGPA